MNQAGRRAAKRKGKKSPWSRADAALRRQPWRKRERCLLDALKSCWQGGKHTRIYRGDKALAKRAHCHPISIWRAKRDLERAHILLVTHTVGGFTRNPEGELVRAATGYEPHPDLYLAAVNPVPPARQPVPDSLEEYIARRQAEKSENGP